MKKIISFILLAMLVISAFGQTRKSRCSTCDRALGYGETFYLSYGLASDTIGKSDSVWTYEILKESNKKLFGSVGFLFDSLSGTFDTVDITIYGKEFDGSTYDSITSTQLTSGNIADEVWIDLSWTTSVLNNIFKIEVKGTDDDFKLGIDELDFKFLED